MNKSTVKQDGYEWIVRAGKLWGTYEQFASYLGRESSKSVTIYAANKKLTRIKHGKYTLLNKDEVDRVTGAIK